MTATPLAQFESVSKRFGERTVLDSLDLAVERGEVFGLLGPNGAGKTTSVRLLCGLLEPSAGKVSIAGHDVHADPLAARRQIGFVPDGAPLYGNLSPRQHLRLVAELHELDGWQSEAERLLTGLDLADRIDDAIAEFSHGMRQKVALACALIHRPALLILDEPLTGLDAPTTAMFKEVLKAWASGGRSVLYTSHLLDVVERVCDRMAVLDHGKLVGLGSLDDLRARAGNEGTLEEVFGSLTSSSDPAAKARELLA